ncbi:MAG: zf-HC2 domain-containing protein [Acidobacteriota bacterium]
MTSGCEVTRTRFESYLGEALSREERSAVRAHLSECAACRREGSELDPSLLFATAMPERVSDADAARILEGVRAGIALKTAERRVRRVPSHRKRAGATAAAAAAVLLALTLTSPSPARLALARANRLSAAAGPGRTSLPAAAGTRAAVPAGESGSEFGAPAMTARPFSPFAEAGAPGGQKAPADATIYDWNPGGGQPRVVWIVDRSLDI